MPPKPPIGQVTDTPPALLPNRYGPIVFSYQSNTATRFAPPCVTLGSSPARMNSEIWVPAGVVPSGFSMYASIAHATWYDGASLATPVVKIAVWPAGTPAMSSENVVPSP